MNSLPDTDFTIREGGSEKNAHAAEMAIEYIFTQSWRGQRHDFAPGGLTFHSGFDSLHCLCIDILGLQSFN